MHSSQVAGFLAEVDLEEASLAVSEVVSLLTHSRKAFRCQEEVSRVVPAEDSEAVS